MKKFLLILLSLCLLCGCQTKPTDDDDDDTVLTPEEIIEDIGFTYARYSSDEEACDLIICLDKDMIRFYAMYQNDVLQAIRYRDMSVKNQPGYIWGMDDLDEALVDAYHQFLSENQLTNDDFMGYLTSLAQPREVNIISNLMMYAGVSVDGDEDTITITYQNASVTIQYSSSEKIDKMMYQSNDKTYDILNRSGDSQAFFDMLFELDITREEWQLFVYDCIEQYI